MRDGEEPDRAPAADLDQRSTGASDGRSGDSVIRQRMPRLALAKVFLQIGATSFGGLGPFLASVERELVAKRQVLTANDVTEAAALARLLPGSALIQVVSMLGYRLGGWTGSALATVACLLPPTMAMLVLALVYDRVGLLSALKPASQGLVAAAVGLLLAMTYRFSRAAIGGPLTLAIALAAFGSAAGLGAPAAAVVVAGGMLGILFLSASAPADASGSGTRGGR
jgi:chromate transporter